MPFGWKATIRRLRKLLSSFPETPEHKLLQRERALRRRRAKNKVARASRTRNRRT